MSGCIRPHQAELAAFARAMDTRLHGKTEPSVPPDDPLLVECWTPAGDRILVKARDAEHAKWLRKMNPHLRQQAKQQPSRNE